MRTQYRVFPQVNCLRPPRQILLHGNRLFFRDFDMTGGSFDRHPCYGAANA
jgi:hypothetical protein